MKSQRCGLKTILSRNVRSVKAAAGLMSRASAFAALPLLVLFFIVPMPRTLAGPADDILDVKLLGVSTARLGVLYDFNTRQFLPETLWPQDDISGSTIVTPMPHSDFKMIAGNTIDDRLWGLEVKASLALDVLAGLVKISGSGQYLGVERKSSRHEAVTYRDTRTDRYEQLDMDRLMLPGYPDNIPRKGKPTQVDATHVVVGIMYGASACFTFQREVQEFEDTRIIFGELLLQVNKFPAFSIEVNARVNFTEQQKKEFTRYSVQFNGDYALRRIPDTYLSALEVYAELGQYFVPVPIAVTLYPLKRLGKDTDDVMAEITTNLIDQVKRKFQEIQDLMEDLRGLYDDVVRKTQKIVDVFSSYKEKLDLFGQLLSSFKINFQLRLKEALPAARKANNMTLLNQLLKNISNSPFKYGSLKGWLDAKRAEFNVLKKYLKPMEEIHLADDQRLVEFSTDFRRRTRVALELKVETAAKHDSFLLKMENYLADVRELQRRTRKVRGTQPAVDTLQTFRESRLKRQSESEDTPTGDQANPAPPTIEYGLVPSGTDSDADKQCPKENENEYRPSKRETWYQEPNLQGRMRLRAGQLINFWKANQENKEQFLFFTHGGHVNVSDENDTPDCHLTMYHEEEAFYDTSLLSPPQNLRRVPPKDTNPIAIVLKEPKTVHISWDFPKHNPDGNNKSIQFIFYNRSSLSAGADANATNDGFTRFFIGHNTSIDIVFQDHVNESIEVMVQAVADFGFSATTEVQRIFYGKQRYCGVLENTFDRTNASHLLAVSQSYIITAEGASLVWRNPADFSHVKNATLPAVVATEKPLEPLDALCNGSDDVFVLSRTRHNMVMYRGTEHHADVNIDTEMTEYYQPHWQFVRNAIGPNSTTVTILCKNCLEHKINKSSVKWNHFDMFTYNSNGVSCINLLLKEGRTLGSGEFTERHQAAYSPERAANFKHLEGPRLFLVARENYTARDQTIFNSSADNVSLGAVWQPIVRDPYGSLDPAEGGTINLFTDLGRFTSKNNGRVLKVYDAVDVDELGNILILRKIIVESGPGAAVCEVYAELLLFNAIGEFVTNLATALPSNGMIEVECVELGNRVPDTEYSLDTHHFFTRNGNVYIEGRKKTFKVQYLEIVYH